MDYVARRLAVDHLPVQRRVSMGLLTAGERQTQAGAMEDTWADLRGLAICVPQQAPHS